MMFLSLAEGEPGPFLPLPVLGPQTKLFGTHSFLYLLKLEVTLGPPDSGTCPCLCSGLRESMIPRQETDPGTIVSPDTKQPTRGNGNVRNYPEGLVLISVLEQAWP